MRKYVFIIIMMFVTSLCICVYAEDINSLQEQSNDLTEKLDITNNMLQAVQDELSQNMQQLQELDSQILQSQVEINTVNEEIAEIEEQISENEEKLKQIQEESDKLQDTVDERLILMYERPKLQFLQILLESKSANEFISTYYALKELIKYDDELIKTVKQQKNEIETTKKILEEKRNIVIAQKQKLQKKSRILENDKIKRNYYVSKLTEEEKNLQEQIDDYNSQVQEIEAEIKFLALNSISEDYIGGAMIWPIPGYTNITSKYGMRVHPITNAYKLHTGMDVGAPMGASFVASANGIVVKATYNNAYGNMVIIDHGGGVQTLYAHGSEIVAQLGQTVSAGDEILKVGSTGYSTGAHAHFEIRINGITVNPEEYLLEDNFSKLKEKTDQTEEKEETEETKQEDQE